MPGGPMQGGPHRAGLVLSKREKNSQYFMVPSGFFGFDTESAAVRLDEGTNQASSEAE